MKIAILIIEFMTLAMLITVIEARRKINGLKRVNKFLEAEAKEWKENSDKLHTSNQDLEKAIQDRDTEIENRKAELRQMKIFFAEQSKKMVALSKLLRTFSENIQGKSPEKKETAEQ